MGYLGTSYISFDLTSKKLLKSMKKLTMGFLVLLVPYISYNLTSKKLLKSMEKLTMEFLVLLGPLT